jgi:hypothetical protein
VFGGSTLGAKFKLGRFAFSGYAVVTVPEVWREIDTDTTLKVRGAFATED